MMSPVFKLVGSAGSVVGVIVVLLLLVLSGDKVTVEINGVELTEKAQQSYDQVVRTREVEALRDETPPGSSVQGVDERAEAIRKSQRAAEATTTGPDAPPPETLTLATPRQRGCGTRLVRNFSSRRGARPALWVLHYTVSPNRPGTADVNAIVAWFNNPRSQASSNYLIDKEGRCRLLVSEAAKAWTQGFFNPWSISVEVINTGRERTYAGRKGLRKLGRVVSDSTKRWGIPLRRARTSGCRVVRSGITDHDRLGCGNSHTDIKPYKVSQVLRAAKRARPRVTREARTRCRKLTWWRNRVRRGERVSGRMTELAVYRRKYLERRGLRCVKGRARVR